MWFRGRAEVTGWGGDHRGGAVRVPAALTSGTLHVLENEWISGLTICFSLETFPVILLCAKSLRTKS